MKLTNFFKKRSAQTAGSKKSNIEKLNTKALKNVMGGGDPIPGVDVKLGKNKQAKHQYL